MVPQILLLRPVFNPPSAPTDTEIPQSFLILGNGWNVPVIVGEPWKVKYEWVDPRYENVSQGRNDRKLITSHVP